MAQSLRRPLFQCIGLSSSVPRRQFTQISPRWAGPAQAQSLRSKQRADKSMRVLQKEQMQSGELPSDMGLLDQTFVTPIIKLSSLFTAPRTYFRWQFTKFRCQLGAYGSLLALKVTSPRAGKRWYNKQYKMDRKSVCPEALRLHTEMYSAFAEGHIMKLSKLCTDGLFGSFNARISARKRGEVWKWELLKYNGASKVVSDKAAMIPNMDGFALRQAVVRISSQQRLTRSIDGKKVEGSGEAKDVLEYVVVQSLVEKWEVRPWKVWGTTPATTLEDLDQWKRRSKSG